MIGDGPGDPASSSTDRRGAPSRPASATSTVLLERLRQDGPRREDVIDFANWRYYGEALKRERYGVDAQEVRRYFDFGKVRQGLLDVTGRLFGLRYEPVARRRPGTPTSTSYDVSAGGERQPLGRIHLDLHPREGKYNHAAQFTLVPGRRAAASCPRACWSATSRAG